MNCLSLQRLIGYWSTQADDLAAQYADGTPFPLVVLDDFLAKEHAIAVLDEFPDILAMPRSRDYMFANKHELSRLSGFGDASSSLHRLLTGPDFESLVSTIRGHKVFIDQDFFGGGFHQSGPGGYLDMHTDFNVHPLRSSWHRQLNILLYLNQDWSVADGGMLDLRNADTGVSREVEPLFNRLVIMETSNRTLHGFRQLPAGAPPRRSIAAYAYRVDENPPAARTTSWVPEGAPLSKRLLARNWNGLVAVKNRVFGSGTTRNK